MGVVPIKAARNTSIGEALAESLEAAQNGELRGVVILEVRHYRNDCRGVEVVVSCGMSTHEILGYLSDGAVTFREGLAQTVDA